MMITPPYLTDGSRIALVAPARKISLSEIETSLVWLRENNFVPVFDDDLFDVENQYAGSDEHRAAMINKYLNDDSIDALWCVRGGYGSLRIVDSLDIEALKRKPKWIIGYSDVTVLHALAQHHGVESLHATMPINVHEPLPRRALSTLLNAVRGEELSYSFGTCPMNRCGKAEGVLLGGNLSVLYSMLGSATFPRAAKMILFIEDLSEYLYHIDRMMVSLRRAGVFENLSGLIVGSFTEMNDNTIPFGRSVEEIITDAVRDYHFPVAFGFPAGHQHENVALRLGAQVTLDVTPQLSTLNFQLNK